MPAIHEWQVVGHSKDGAPTQWETMIGPLRAVLKRGDRKSRRRYVLDCGLWEDPPCLGKIDASEPRDNMVAAITLIRGRVAKIAAVLRG